VSGLTSGDPILEDYASDGEMVGHVRFGDWHPSETSHNYATGGPEIGVSVFGAVRKDGRWDLLLERYAEDDEDHGDLYDTFVALTENIGRDIFLVSGEFVGWGYDGDPLLRSLQKHALLEPGDLQCSEMSWRPRNHQ
jgi:hypothetical protein